MKFSKVNEPDFWMFAARPKSTDVVGRFNLFNPDLGNVLTSVQNLGYDFSGVDKPKNDTDFYGLRYAEFVVPLVKAVQELDKKAATLEAENTALKEMLKNYESRLQALEDNR